MATGGGATSIGGLIIELRANSAQFHAEMEAARKGLKGTGDAAHGSGRQLSRFAAIALEEVVPGLRGFRVGLEQIIQKAPQAAIALAAVGSTAAVVAAVGVAAVGVGTAIAHLGGQRSFIDNWREAGHISEGFIDRLKLTIGIVGAYEERVKKATEEGNKFNESLREAGALRRGFARDIAQNASDVRAAGRRLNGDEEAAIREELNGRLEAIEAAHVERLAAIDEKFKADNPRRRELEIESEKKTASERVKAKAEAAVKYKKIDDDDAKQRIETWQKETQVLVSALKDRVAARKAFEAQLGAGATALGLGRSSTAGVATAARNVDESLGARSLIPRAASSAGLSPFQGITAADVQAVRDLDEAWKDVVKNQEAYAKALRELPGATQGLKDVANLTDNLKKATEDLAFNIRDFEESGGQTGLSSRDAVQEQERIRQRAIDEAQSIKDKFGHIPAVLDAVDKAIASVKFGNLGREMARARIEIDRTETGLKSLTDQAAAIERAFKNVPSATEQARLEIKKLGDEFNNTAWQIHAAIVQLNNYNNVADNAPPTPAPEPGSSGFRVILPTEQQTGVD